MVEDKILGLLPASLEASATIGDLPAARDNALAIMLYDGDFNTEYFGTRNDSTVRQPIIKVVVRHNDYEIGRSWIDQVKDALHRYNDEYFLSILLVGSPMYLGKSEQKLHEFQVTFRTTIKE